MNTQQTIEIDKINRIYGKIVEKYAFALQELEINKKLGEVRSADIRYWEGVKLACGDIMNLLEEILE